MTTACHVLPFVLTMTMIVLLVNPLPNGLQPRSDLLLVAAGDTDGHVSFWNANRDASKPSDRRHSPEHGFLRDVVELALELAHLEVRWSSGCAVGAHS